MNKFNKKIIKIEKISKNTYFFQKKLIFLLNFKAFFDFNNIFIFFEGHNLDLKTFENVLFI